MPSADAARVRDLFLKYIDQRIVFYESNDERQLGQATWKPLGCLGELWSAVLPLAKSQPTPVTALTVAGMNDVLNSQGYTQAAWWNRIPRQRLGR